MPVMLPLLPVANLGRDASILKSITEPNAYLALWHRLIPDHVADWIASWHRKINLELDALVSVEETRLMTARALIDAGCRGQTEIGWLCDDIERLAVIFSTITGELRLRVRLETVRDDGCSKFHVDTLKLRLLCTYAGPGTQWIPAGQARRDYLGWIEGSTEEANARIAPDPQAVQTMATGAVAVFKGRLYPGFEGQGLVHRSAPVCCEKEYRLRLCLDLPRD